MIHVNPSKVRNRRACNRCHQAKLKCVVVESNRKCQRCKRSSVDCTFSPPTRLQQSQQQQQQQQQQHHDPECRRTSTTPSSAAMDMDWDLLVEPSALATAFTFEGTQQYHQPQHHGGHHSLGLSDILMSPTHTMPCIDYDSNNINENTVDKDVRSHNASNGQDYDELLSSDAFFNMLSTTNTTMVSAPPSLATSHLGDTRHPSVSSVPPTATSMVPSLLGDEAKDNGRDNQPLIDPASWVSKLASLHVHLTKHLQTMPRVATLDAHLITSASIPPPSSAHDTVRTIELSESFVTVLSAMSSALPTSTSTSPSSSSSSSWSSSSASFPSPPTVDEPTRLLLFATYLRFLEIQETVHRYMLAFLLHKRNGPITAGSGATRTCFIPKLSFGTFELDVASATRPLVLVNLMESMLSRARMSMQHLTSAKMSAPGDVSSTSAASSPLVIEHDAALQAIQAREAALVALVKRFKDALLQSKSLAL